jgi:hypothetical protein
MIAVITAFTICSGTVKAQEPPITLGVKGGINLSNLYDMKNTENSLRYRFAITADIVLYENLYLLTGIEFHSKGTKCKPASDKNTTYNPKYLQLPLHLGYKIKLADNMKFVIDAGPYIAYGVGGKVKGKTEANVFDKNGFKRFDYGIGGGLGIEFSKLSLNIGYDFGLANINNAERIKDTKSIKIRNRNAFATLGYKF